MRHWQMRHRLGASACLLLASACGGLAESRPPSEGDFGSDVELEPSTECQSSGCEEPPAPALPGAPEPLAGRVCDVITTSGTLTVNDQSELDALEGCERIAGSLTLRAFPGMDPSPLRSLRRVDGSLRVDATRTRTEPVLAAFGALEEVNSLLLAGLRESSLVELARLRRVGIEAGSSAEQGRILIRNSEALRSLEGLDALQAAESLELRDNPLLTSLSGFASVRELARVVVTNTPLQSLDGIQALGVRDLLLTGTQLQDLSGLGAAPRLSVLALSENPRLTSLQGAELPERLDAVRLLDNAQLADLAGLASVREVDELLVEVTASAALSSLAGLGALERVRSLTLRGLPLLTSLHGLESLREADALTLQGLAQLESLQGLSALERAGHVSLDTPLQSLEGLNSPGIGTLDVLQGQLRTLAGLENATVSDALNLNNLPQLASLGGLPRLAEAASLKLAGLPALADIDAARAITALAVLEVADTAVSNLDAFANLRQLGELHLSVNPRLTQLDGLAGLTQLRTLFVWSNPELRSLPVFGALEGAACSGCFAELTLQVSDNPNLQTGPGLPLLERAQGIHVANNARLTSLDGLATLRAASYISIEQNPSLLTLALPALSQAEDLRIRYNHALDDTPLAPLRSLPGARFVKIVSNAPGPAGLSPCPWPRDDECDEANGDCAAGTDASDCGGVR